MARQDTPTNDMSLRWTVCGNRDVTVRGAEPGDVSALRRFIDGLSRESRYFRFLSGGQVGDAVVSRVLGRHDGRDIALVVTDGDEVVANAVYVVNDADEAEFAVVVADAWQGRGLGRRLIQHLQQLARAAGLRGMRGDVLSENRRMLAIVRELGFSTRRAPGDAYVQEVSLRLASVRREAWLAHDWFQG
ncbi:GNAT family N-acetyltransferase [Cupriavidus plantarum]|uniref:GNAT family N-acetyltransferase n=1 Tax=Cupriavidus plantarum TaxID=942865 RepID=UPI000EB1C07F|nr:acetyltransferase (GNAT) family protein [Cupriavidus plantarum]